MPQSLSLKPHAKINLGLLIKGKLPNGYHLLETLLYPIKDIQDSLVLEKSQQKGCAFEIQGIKLDGDLKDNLCVRAYYALVEHLGGLPGVKISLEKNIPAGAGLGGGSSDAAFTLRGLNELFELGLTPDQMAPIAAKLGADVPFFLYDSPMLASGIGTDLRTVNLEVPFIIKVYPQGIHSSTVAAYKALDYTQFDHKRELLPALQTEISNWKNVLVNDLEVPVFEMYPELKSFKNSLYQEGAIYAAMSGSGSAMFGIFKH
ncbi:MAG: 4-(cytidine 5'-diphospho)-2-C-methyl-D-erythritol kinase [Bacteroidia bacterium]|nr:4-(cytidine 5'-diphospho)-2-C-methyl-D-erythritol kinase [Bacteroidia bacterium]